MSNTVKMAMFVLAASAITVGALAIAGFLAR